MLQYYEEKGRKIFFWFMIGFVVVFTFAFYVGKFYAIRSMQQGEKIVAQIDDVQTPTSGQIEYVEGIVESRNAADDGWKAVTKNHILTTGEKVRTLTRARAIVTFEDGTSVRLNENTHIVLVDNVDQMKIMVVQGEIFNSVAKKGQHPFIVQTKDHMITALGTEFDVENTEESTKIIVTESAVSVETHAGQVLGHVREGQKAHVTDDRVATSAIVDDDLKEEFVAWSTKDNGDVPNANGSKSVDETVKVKNDTTRQNSNAKIVLKGEKSSSGVRLQWQLSNVDASRGFKIVKSEETNPVYPGDEYQFISDGAARDFKWKIDTGKKYHFRVCIYDGSGACLLYSNDVYLDTPSQDKEDGDDYASSVTLSAKEDDGAVKLSWTISGGESPKGFKIVKSKEVNPVYPGDDYQYIADSDERSFTWKGFSKGKTYHFRVCIYKGGSCGAYSNDVKVSF